MTKAQETKREKAKLLRYKKPLVKDLNIWTIREELDDIECECDEVRWYCESEDGTDTLINALDGDEDDAYEFKMAFADLCAECYQMREDLNETYIPECFDTIMVAAGAGEYGGGYLGYDSFEQDYYGLDISSSFLESEAAKKLSLMTKKEIIECIGSCFKLIFSYIGLRYRYDSLKAAFDIIRDQNTGVLKVISNINEVYEKYENEGFPQYNDTGRTFKEMCEALPQEAWIA